MLKRYLLAIAGLFIIWSILDYVIHTQILGASYKATAQLWRPVGEMKMGLLYCVTLVYAAIFTLIYGKFFAVKNVETGLKYGLAFGIASGFSMGYGSFAVMPIPYNIAYTWFWGVALECAIGGLALGLIFKDGNTEPAD
ncbi:hypothetical protein MNBD_NITROSPINAE04-2544 [hydrothermal vent metagenome]|uniref:DUF1761 domain-containing protein n=1 Tax=hydrothermal vent metagenome TaxID=652676 RepID=A0A3B1C1K2_9ZZZZ